MNLRQIVKENMDTYWEGSSHKNYISFYAGNNIATAFREQNGEITIHLGEVPKNKSEELIANTSIKNIGLICMWLFFCSLIVKEYYFLPNINSAECSILWYLLPFVLWLIYIVCNIYTVCNFLGDTGRRNHGAEHKIIAAYEKLQRIPSIAEARKFSRISNGCGITLLSSILIGQLIGFVIYCITGFAISEIVLLVVPIFFSSFMPFNLAGMLFQFFTTKEPKDENLELAIAALTAFVENKKP